MTNTEEPNPLESLPTEFKNDEYTSFQIVYEHLDDGRWSARIVHGSFFWVAFEPWMGSTGYGETPLEALLGAAVEYGRWTEQSRQTSINAFKASLKFRGMP